MISLKSQIVITEDFEEIENFLKDSIKGEFLYIIKSDEFKTEDAKESIKRAYVASEREKYIVLIAEKFNIYSQNTLLKIVEEPPKNIVFIIITKSKSSLLPTIRSRLPIAKIKKDKKKEFEIDLRKLDLNYIYNFLKDSSFSKEEAKDFIQYLLKNAIEAGMVFNEKEIAIFERSIKLLELHSNVKNILTTIFLTLLEVKKRAV